MCIDGYTEEGKSDLTYLMFLLTKFDRAMYVTSTDYTRWELNQQWSNCMDLSRGLASHFGITTRVANEFWEELKPWCIKTGRYQTRCAWHHGELGGNLDLVAKWDTMLFKIASCFYSSMIPKSMLPYFYDLVAGSSRGQQALPYIQPGVRCADAFDLVAWFNDCLLVPELTAPPAPLPASEEGGGLRPAAFENDPMQEDTPETRGGDPSSFCSPASTDGDGQTERLQTPVSSYEPDQDEDEEPAPPSPLPGHEHDPSSVSVGTLPAVNLAVPPNSTKQLNGVLYTETFFADPEHVVTSQYTRLEEDDNVPDDSVRATVEEVRGPLAAATDTVEPIALDDENDPYAHIRFSRLHESTEMK